MGRGKIEIKRIENTSNRQVTYSKRRNGIIKKAKEITVLCDAQVSLIIFSSSGKMVEYCSSKFLVDILDQYHKQSGKRLWDAKHENLNNEIDRVKKENDSMQLELRHLRGEDINSLNHKELIAMETALEHGLEKIRERQVEIIKTTRKNVKMEEEENKRLSFIAMQQERRQQEMALEENMREMEITEYHNNLNNIRHQQQQQRDFDSQLPFAFRVQPMQPNLQERM